MPTLFNFPVTLLCVVVFSFSGLVESTSAQDKLTTAQTRSLRKIETGVNRAANLFRNNKLPQSAKIIEQLNDDLSKLLADKPSPGLLQAAQGPHDLLKKARQALMEKGQSVKSIPDLPTANMDPNAPVSFTGEVSAILSAQCGSCHVQRNRGQFSMASYAALAAGAGGAPVVIPGKPEESRLIEAIEEGSMPPNGAVPDEQLARLKKWIADGAAFDGDDPNARIAAANRPARRQNLEITRATGNESVSFAIDIAPVLMENCTGCHFEARNARGGLRIDNFQQFLRGGDSGPMIRPGDGANSALVQRLTANDNTRMPRGRRSLDKAIIDKIVTWIDEGAKFDGRQGDMNLREVAAIAASEAATHEELTASRGDDVMKNWKKVMSDVQPLTQSGNEVLVVGTRDNRLLESLASFSDGAANKIKSQLNLKKDQPLVKGKISVFTFDRRYDYSEFGKMVETRDIPKSWNSHWGYDTVNAYVAVLSGKSELSELKPELTHRLASVAVASLGADIPEWFADGMGYVVAEKVISDKKQVKDWQTAAAQAASEMSSPTDFLQGRLANDKSGLVAYVFVKTLRDSNPAQFKEFLKLLQAGNPFEAAFAAIWSDTPVELMRRQFGGGSNNGKRRNRRR